MNQRDMLKNLTELREELYDKESELLRHLTPNGQYDQEGHKMRAIASTRVYREALDMAIGQLKEVVK